jgi:hypothetical protein
MMTFPKARFGQEQQLQSGQYAVISVLHIARGTRLLLQFVSAVLSAIWQI